MICLVLLGTIPAAAQTMSLTEKMEAASARQRQATGTLQSAAARRQVHDPSTASGFFTLPWPAQPAAAVAPAGGTFECDPIDEAEAALIIAEAAERESLSPQLIRAVIQQESAMRPCAVSAKGAQGLMQLMPATSRDLGVGDPFDPRENIAGGTKFLKNLMKRFDGDLSLALAAYNAGPGRISPERQIPNIPETQNYVAQILGRLKIE